MRVADQVWTAIADNESSDVARTWFTGLNPVLDDTSPVIALRDGNARQVLLAARAFLNGTWSA